MVLGKLAEYGRIGGGGGEGAAAERIAGLVEMAARYADEVVATAAPAEGAAGRGAEAKAAVPSGAAVRGALCDFADALERMDADAGGGQESQRPEQPERQPLADRIQGEAFSCARERGARPRDMFAALYGIMLGSSRGPRLGPLIEEVGLARACEMIREHAR